MKIKCIRHNVMTAAGHLRAGDEAEISQDEFEAIMAMDGDNPRLEAVESPKKRGRPKNANR